MSNQPNPKRTYHKPQFKPYGNITTLTQNVAVEGISADGAGMGAEPNKTN